MCYVGPRVYTHEEWKHVLVAEYPDPFVDPNYPASFG